MTFQLKENNSYFYIFDIDRKLLNQLVIDFNGIYDSEKSNYYFEIKYFNNIQNIIKEYEEDLHEKRFISSSELSSDEEDSVKLRTLRDNRYPNKKLFREQSFE